MSSHAGKTSSLGRRVTWRTLVLGSKLGLEIQIFLAKVTTNVKNELQDRTWKKDPILKGSKPQK